MSAQPPVALQAVEPPPPSLPPYCCPYPCAYCTLTPSLPRTFSTRALGEHLKGRDRGDDAGGGGFPRGPRHRPWAGTSRAGAGRRGREKVRVRQKTVLAAFAHPVRRALARAARTAAPVRPARHARLCLPVARGEARGEGRGVSD